MFRMQNTPTDLKTTDGLRRVLTPYIYISFVLSPVSNVLKIPVYEALNSHCHYVTVKSHDNHMIKNSNLMASLLLKRYLQSTPNTVLTAHPKFFSTTGRCVTKAFSTTCAFIVQ